MSHYPDRLLFVATLLTSATLAFLFSAGNLLVGGAIGLAVGIAVPAIVKAVRS